MKATFKWGQKILTQDDRILEVLIYLQHTIYICKCGIRTAHSVFGLISDLHYLTVSVFIHFHVHFNVNRTTFFSFCCMNHICMNERCKKSPMRILHVPRFFVEYFFFVDLTGISLMPHLRNPGVMYNTPSSWQRLNNHPMSCKYFIITIIRIFNRTVKLAFVTTTRWHKKTCYKRTPLSHGTPTVQWNLL